MGTVDSLQSVTARLADFVAGTRFEDLPEAAVHAARRMILDTAGVAIAGAADPHFATISGYAVATAGRGEVPAPAPRLLDVGWAAFLGGAAAHLLDYDDVHTTMGGHPSATLFPVVFSLGCTVRASGAQVLRAFALGVEVEARLGAGINPSHYSIGWHPTSVLGTLGACASAAALLNLEGPAIRRALGIAASHASGTKANFGTLTKSLQVGIAARAGVESALLARAGATANDRILDEQFGGYCELFSAATDRSRMVEGLGERYLLVDPGVGVKLLPCCGSAQGAAWAMIDLWREHRFDAARLRTVHTWVDRQRLPHTNRPLVRTGLEGKFSTQYCQAAAALQGWLGLADFETEAVGRPERQALMKLVHLYEAPDADRWPDAGDPTGSQGARVVVEMDNGTVHQTFLRCPRGYPALPASEADLEAKFLDCAARGLGPEGARDLADRLRHLEAAADITPIAEVVWAGSRAG